jgi:quercetin dioxygenase-like cupin family protein
MQTVSEMRLTRWNRTQPPDGPVLRHVLQMEGFSVLEWTDSPGTIYPVHTHPFIQVRVILGGHLRIGLPETGEEVLLSPGDRLDLPADTPHWEEVNGGQATCLTATRTDGNHATGGNPPSIGSFFHI